jgi:predicted nucleotidyltransferase component of viral defense system
MQNDDKTILSMQIEDTVNTLESLISKSAVEKDIYVTKIIHAMSQVEHEYYRLVFQGGTCLAKAHKIIL